jgi:hypothetical protein
MNDSAAPAASRLRTKARAPGTEGEALAQPAAKVVQGCLAELVRSGVAVPDRCGPGGAVEVLPRALEKFGGDYTVVLALRDEHRERCEPSGTSVDAGLERHGPVEDRCACEALGIVEDESTGGCCTSAEPDENDRPAGRRDVVEPAAKPTDRGAQRLGDRPTDAPVGEPGVAAALCDRSAHRRVGEAIG